MYGLVLVASSIEPASVAAAAVEDVEGAGLVAIVDAAAAVVAAVEVEVVVSGAVVGVVL